MTTLGLNTREPQLNLRPIRGFEPAAARELRNRLLRFEYETTTKAIDVARFELDNTDGALMSVESIALGISIEVQWGYVGALTLPRTAICKKVSGMAGDREHGGGRRPNRESLGGQGKIMLECWAETQAMHRLGFVADLETDVRERGPRAFTAMRISDIAREIARAYGVRDADLHIEAPPADPIREYVYVPTDETHAQFLQRQADLIGWVFYLDDTGFHFHSQDYDRTPKVRLAYFSGDPDIKNYQIDGDFTFNAPTRMHARGLDTRGYRVVGFDVGIPSETGDTTGASGSNENVDPEVGQTQTTTSLLGRGRYVNDVVSGHDVFTLPRISERGLNAALRKLKAHARRKWKLKAECVGHPYLFAKQWFTLAGTTSLTDGDWYLMKVTHRYEAGGVYTTTIDEARRDKPRRGGGSNVVTGFSETPQGSNAEGPRDPTRYGIGLDDEYEPREIESGD